MSRKCFDGFIGLLIMIYLLRKNDWLADWTFAIINPSEFQRIFIKLSTDFMFHSYYIINKKVIEIIHEKICE